MKIITFSFISLLVFPIISEEQIQTVLPVSNAQDGSLTAVAYDWEVIGVNPANLGWKVNHKFSFTILCVGASAQSEGMNFPALMSFAGSQSLLSGSNNSQQILGAPNGATVVADITWFAASFRIPKIPGAFAVNMRDRIEGNGFLGANSALAVGNGENKEISDQATLTFLNGTTLQYDQYREINLDYGVPLFTVGGDGTADVGKCFSFDGAKATGNDKATIYGGVGFKYLIGLANVNATVVNSGINAVYDISSNYPDILPKGFSDPLGDGYAFDLGLSAIYGRWKFAVSATDIGSITWKHGYTTTADTTIYQILHGSDLWNEVITGTLAGSQPAPDYSTALPSKLRMGIAYEVTPQFLLSFDFISPLNSSPIGLNVPYIALGGQVKISRHFKISTGIATATGYGWGVPLGISITMGKHIEFYTGTNDITAFVGKSRDAEVSTAIGVFRYNL